MVLVCINGLHNNHMRTLLASLALLLIFFTNDFAQNCAPPPIVFNAKTVNIFSPEQEMFLGEAETEHLEGAYRVIDDAAINAYLQSLGDRISKHLPATGIRFRFMVVDIPDTNAFTLPGGRIFVTRKLLSFVHNEDELAGVIGHELGHATVRHGAIDMSRYLKELLGVTHVGDRSDIFEKYNRFLETYRTKKVKFADNHSDKEQLEADHIGVFAAFAAGFDPNAMTAFWTRLTNAKKGNFFSDLFGAKNPEDKRLREMLEAVKQINPVCIEKLSGSANAEFEKWRGFVINYSGLGAKESLTGLIYRRPLVPLRSDIEYLRFSPNGQYIIAQDNSSVSVLQRQPLAVLFRVDIEDAFFAAFSADSRSIVVYNKNLRVQKWNIADKSVVSTYEIAIPGGYWQTRISPDGRYMAAYRYSGDLVLYDVATNAEVYKEKEFYLPSYWERYAWEIYQLVFDETEYPAINLEFSPDGKYFLAGRKFSPQFGADSRETTAVDLTTFKKISIGDNIKKALVSAMDFMGPDKIIGRIGTDNSKSGIFAFPTGDRLDQFELSGERFTRSEVGNFIAVRPVAGAAVGLYDLKTKKYVLGNKKSALDIYEKTFVAERRNGEVALYTLGVSEPTATLPLPASPFGSLRASSISADGKWLSISDRSRGAAWNLKTGERVQHIRGFRGSYFTPDGRLYADFPKLGETPRTMVVMDLANGTMGPAGYKLEGDNVHQHGKYLVLRRPNKEKKDKEEKPSDKPKPFVEEEAQKTINYKETTMEVRDAQSGASLWTRVFDKETPSYYIDPERDTMELSWSVNSQAAKDIIGADPALKAKLATMDEKQGDLLIQLVDPKSGRRKADFLLETGEGSITVDYVRVAGDFLTIEDGQNRILVYSISTGKLLQRFFGGWSTISLATNKIAIQNLPGRLTVYDLVSGKEVGKLSFTKPTTFVRFLDDGKQLFVLTSDQTAFLFDTSKLATAAPAGGDH